MSLQLEKGMRVAPVALPTALVATRVSDGPAGVGTGAGRDGGEGECGPRVRCVLRTECQGGSARLVSIEGGGGMRLFITPWHPVLDCDKGCWVFPVECGEVREAEPCPAVYR